MKKVKLVFVTLVILLITISCSKAKKETNSKEKDISIVKNKIVIENDILGVWEGNAENDNMVINLTKITKDSIFGKSNLLSTINGNTRIKLLKGTYTKENKSNIINATLTEYKVNSQEKPKYKVNGVMKIKKLNDKINGILVFEQSQVKFNLIKTQVKNSSAILSINKNIEKSNELIQSKNETNIFISDEKDFTLIGKWYGVFGNHDYDYYVRIDSIKSNKIYGKAKNGLYKTYYDIKGDIINTKGVYKGTVTETKLRNNGSLINSTKKTFNVVFDINKRNGKYDGMNLQKYPTTSNGLVKGIKGHWEGEIVTTKFNREQFSIDISKTLNKQDSIFGTTLMKATKYGNRVKNIIGFYKVEHNKWDSHIKILFDENDSKGYENEKFKTNGNLNLIFLNGKLEGEIVIGNKKFNVELKKTERKIQTKIEEEELNKNIIKLQKLTVKLVDNEKELFHYGSLASYSLVKKYNKNYDEFITHYNRTVKRPSSKFNREQEEVVNQCLMIILKQKSNSKLQRLLDKR